MLRSAKPAFGSTMTPLRTHTANRDINKTSVDLFHPGGFADIYLFSMCLPPYHVYYLTKQLRLTEHMDITSSLKGDFTGLFSGGDFFFPPCRLLIDSQLSVGVTWYE